MNTTIGPSMPAARELDAAAGAERFRLDHVAHLDAESRAVAEHGRNRLGLVVQAQHDLVDLRHLLEEIDLVGEERAIEDGNDGLGCVEKLLDELGDVLFQVYFLALLLEERGAGSLAEVAEHCRAKLIRRHPHVFGDREADTAAAVVRNWDEIKREQEGRGEVFGSIPETLPSTLYAKKVLRRARSAGHEWGGPGDDPGDRLLAAVRDAVAAGADPELALRQAADRFKDEVERG